MTIPARSTSERSPKANRNVHSFPAMSTFSAPALANVRVSDCMHHGIFGCSSEASLLEVAAIMSARHVHALVVHHDAGRPTEIVSDMDVIAGAACSDAFCATDVAGTEPVSISGDRSLRDAAQLMAEHGVSHLIVKDSASGEPIGVISTTDILSAYAHPAAQGTPG
jgi:predicted transcriptional regulator